MASDNRFSVYTSIDHRAPLWIVTLLSMTYSLIFLIIRLGVKRRLLGLDDVWLGVSHVLGIAQWAIILQALQLGAGESVEVVPEPNFKAAAKLVFSSQLLMLVALGLSKGSVVHFLRNLFTKENKTAWRWCNSMLSIIIVWVVAAPLVIGAGSSPAFALSPSSPAKRAGDIRRWRAVAAVDICTEACLVFLPAYFFSKINMGMKKKLTVIVAFGFRVCIAAFFVVFLQSHTEFVEHGRPSIDSINSLIWQQVLLSTALCTATIPCLKVFLSNFKTGDAARLLEGYNFQPHTSITASQEESYVLSSLKRASIEQSKNPPTREEFLSRPAANVVHMATAYAASSRSKRHDRARSAGSEEMIIHRSSTIEWEISDIEPHLRSASIA